MKKVSKKLSLNRETLAPLSPDLLDRINGGQAIASAPTTRTVGTLTTTISIPTGPSRVICPPTVKCR